MVTSYHSLRLERGLVLVTRVCLLRQLSEAVSKGVGLGATRGHVAKGVTDGTLEEASVLGGKLDPILQAIQALGGNGYTSDYPTGRLLRDAKLYEIGAGTSEVRRMLIGRELFSESS